MIYRTTILMVLVAALLVMLPQPAHAAAPPPPEHGSVRSVGTSWVHLQWSRVRGASSYEVLRDGRLIARTSATRLVDRNLRSSTYYGYRVRARAGRAVSRASDLLPAVTHASAACTHWVSTTRGSNVGDGSWNQPWYTVQHLVDRAYPGMVGCLTGHFVEDITVRRGGSSGRKVVVRSAPGHRAVIEGRIWIAAGANHVTFSSLDLDGRAHTLGGEGLPSPTINAAHAVFERNTVTNRRTRVCFVLGSIRGWGRAAFPVLASNRIHSCGYRSAAGTGNNHHHGIYVENAIGAKIVHNVIWNNADRGIQLYPNAQRTTIARNLLDGNGEGIIFSGAEGYSSSGNMVIRNVVTNSRTRYDIEHYWAPGTAPGRANVVVRSCLGGGAQGEMSLPAVGWRAVGTVIGTPAYRDRLRGDFRLVDGRGGRCHALLRSGVLPLAP